MADTSSRIEDDHHQLRNTLEQLEGATHPSQMASLLGRLNGQLLNHFQEEEGPDGLARMIGSTLPQHLTQLDRLFEEHTDFLTRISGITDRLDEIQAAVASVRGDLDVLCSDLRRHEARETRLLTDEVLTDIGPGD